uniref:Uncharacterized protein n=1 Tax=Chenopodium quinoa TaxID=63459 RepID=A0A803MB37_CHEQI
MKFFKLKKRCEIPSVLPENQLRDVIEETHTGRGKFTHASTVNLGDDHMIKEVDIPQGNNANLGTIGGTNIGELSSFGKQDARGSEFVSTAGTQSSGPMRALREAYLPLMPNVPLNSYDRFPNFPLFNMVIKILIWNVQGVGNKLALIRELVRINNLTVLVLVETNISVVQAQNICDQICFSGQTRVDAQGFIGGIRVFWEEEEVIVTS